MSLKKQAISGVIWTFAQQFSVQAINFGVQILLARLLLPEMFGLIAMIRVFIAIGEMLMDGGMTTSLIRTKKPDQLDYSTVFMTNFFVSTLIYILIFIAAPYIAKFYDKPILSDITRVFALTFVIRALVAVHLAKLTKELNFKLQMKLQVPSTIIGAIVGVTMAYMGYGVWSLVWLNLAQVIAFTIQNWIFIDWKPTLQFNKRRFKYHFNFGYKMTLSGLLDKIYNNAYNIIIGKFFSPAQVGFFTQAETMRLFPVNQVSTVMGKVTYPLFADIKTDKQLKSAYTRTMKLILSGVIPMMLVLIIVAEEFFLLLFGEKWLPAVPYFQMLSFASIVRPISTYNLNILKIKGRSDLFLKVEVIKKIIGVIAIAVAIPFGIVPLILSLTIVSYLFVGINMVYSGNLIHYRLLEQLKDVSGLFIIGFIVADIIYYLKLSFFDFQSIVSLLVFPVLFFLVYTGAIFLFEREIIVEIKNLIKK